MIAATPTAVASTSWQGATETIITQSRRRKRSRLSPDAGSLVPVRLVEDAEPVAASEASTSRPSPPVEIILPRGTRIRVEHGCASTLLQRVLAVLESRPC